MKLQKRKKKHPVARQRSTGPLKFQNTKKKGRVVGAMAPHGTVPKLARKERIKDKTEADEGQKDINDLEEDLRRGRKETP